MKTLFFLMILFLVVAFDTKADAQIKKTIDSLRAVEQSCLDKGIHMENCSCDYRQQMDSILNAVYNNIRSNLNSIQKEKLKDEEIAWLKKRSVDHKKSYQESGSAGIQGDDAEMMACDKDAGTIEDRIYSVIKNWDFKKIYSN